jgi:hypothetical protein
VDNVISSRDHNQKLYQESVDQIHAMHETVEATTKQRDELRQLYKEANNKSTELDEMVKVYKKEVSAVKEKLDNAGKTLAEQQKTISEQLKQLDEAEKDTMRVQMRLVEMEKASRVGSVEGLKPAPEAPPLMPLSIPSSLPPPPPPLPPGLSNIPLPPPLPNLMGPNAFSAPPPAPPLGLPGFAAFAPPGMKPKRRIQPNVNLPMLNWVPLRKIQDTIFEGLDDESILTEMDFSEFEAEFKVKEVHKVLDNAKMVKKKKNEVITTMESNRARNLVITVRRIGMAYDVLKDVIASVDLPQLPPEHAQLLLGFVPSDDEVIALEKHSHHKDRLAEAERFMFEMLKVERYESRLRVMSYIGHFDELALTVGPQIDAVLEASEALMKSATFKKVQHQCVCVCVCVC